MIRCCYLWCWLYAPRTHFIIVIIIKLDKEHKFTFVTVTFFQLLKTAKN